MRQSCRLLPLLIFLQLFSNGITGQTKKTLSPAAVINSSSCENEGFESTAPGTYSASNAVAGWTLSSATRNFSCISNSTSWSPGSPNFTIHSTPLLNVPGIGVLPHSPLGGTRIAQLNGYSIPNSTITSLAKSFPVTTSNNLFSYAFAAAFSNVGHGCCDGPAFEVVVKDCSNQQTCHSFSVVPTSTACTLSAVTLTNSSIIAWTGWQIRQIDLTPFMGSCVTIEFRAMNCEFGTHYGVVYLDTQCGSQDLGPNCSNCINLLPVNPVAFCPGGPATILAPAGYSTYQWVSPVTGTISAPAGTSSITIANPTAGLIYTLNLATGTGCLYQAQYTLATTQVSIGALGWAGTCAQGTSGSASVLATGSGSGYNYIWTNSSGSVVSTNSVATGLAMGNYSVLVTSPSGSLCGSSHASISVGIQPPVPQTYAKPFCGGTAILTTPPGSNHKWYYANTLTSTVAAFMPSSPNNGQVYNVGYTNIYGCRDSVNYILYSSNAGILALTNNPMICEGSSSGAAVFTLTPAGTSLPGTGGFSVISTGQTPPYNYTVANTSAKTFSLSGLSGGGTYSVVAFDGSCYTSTQFTTNTFYTANLFTLTSAWSPSICQGSSLPLAVSLSGSYTPAEFTYSWSPSASLTSSNSLNVFATPSAPSGSAGITIYSVTVTPTLINCPASRTIAVLVSHPLTPTVTSPGAMCQNHHAVQIQATPPGGTFLAPAGSGLNSAGMLNPSSGTPGVHTFSYQNALNNCSATAVSAFTIAAQASLAITGNTNICSGETTTLTASGASGYSWSGGQTGSLVTISPTSTTVFTVLGTTPAGCNDSAQVVVLVTATPSLSVSGNTVVCSGQPATLTATGAGMYVWSNSVNAAQNVVAPGTTTTYSLTGINLPGNCTDLRIITVKVHPLPSISISGPAGSCAGEPVQLIASGAFSYLWNGTHPGTVLTATLHATAAFLVVGTDSNGCSDSTSHTILVDPCADVSENELKKRVVVYPNPVNEKLFFSLHAAADIALYDAYGKILIRKQLMAGSHSLDLSSFYGGMYFLEVQTAQGNQITKIVKEQK